MYARQHSGGGESNPSLAGIAALIGPSQDFEAWPDNWPAISLVNDLKTQLIPGGGGGVLGFNYIPYFKRMGRMKLSEQEYEWLFDDIRAIESEALTEINKKD